MERRNILKKTKEETKPEPKPETPSIEEGTFEEVKPAHEIEEPTKVQIQPKKEKKPKQYEHLSKAREKSLENRRKKKEEQLRLKLEKEALEKELQELKNKFNQVPAPEVPKIVNTPPPVMKPKPSVMDNGIDYDLLADKIYGKFQSVQTGIREDERRLAQREYEEKLRQYKEQQPRNPVPKLSMYGGRRKANRAFDMSAGTGYHGMNNY